MSAGAPPPSSPYPRSSRVVPISDPVAMPSPPSPSSPAAAEDEERRPCPPMKRKLFPRAVYCVFGGMGRTGTGEIILAAWVGIHYLLILVHLLSSHTGGEQARFWTLVSLVVQSLCVASTMLIIFLLIVTCVFTRYYMGVDGEYNVTFHPPPRHLAPVAAAEQLPPPPPEIEMC